jgi:hypothetical protein
LERLSTVLSAYTLPNTFSDAEVFRSRVALRVAHQKVTRATPMSWIWYVVPVSLASLSVLCQGVLYLANVLGLITGSAKWSGMGVLSSADPWLSELMAPKGVFTEVIGSPWLLLLHIVLPAAIGFGLLLVLVSYVGWVSALWRAGVRPKSLEGE